MLVDELVDRRLIGRFDLLELQAHADPAIAPGDARLRFDVALRSGQPEAHPHLRSLLERAHRPDRHAPLAQVQRQRRGDRVAEPIGDRDAEHDARAAAAVEVVGEEVRRQRRQDVLHRAVFVDVAGDTPSAASSRTSSALAIVPLNTRIGSRPPSSFRIARTSSTPPACGSRRSSTMRSIRARSRAHARRAAPPRS